MCRPGMSIQFTCLLKRSRGPVSRVLCTATADASIHCFRRLPFIHYRCRHRSLSFYPPARTDSPPAPPHNPPQSESMKRSIAGLRELSTSGVHGTHVTMRPVSSCLTFSPLLPYPRKRTKRIRGRLFSSAPASHH